MNISFHILNHKEEILCHIEKAEVEKEVIAEVFLGKNSITTGIIQIPYEISKVITKIIITKEDRLKNKRLRTSK